MNRDNDMNHVVSPIDRSAAIAALRRGDTVGDAALRAAVHEVADAVRADGTEVVVRDVWAGPGATLWTIAHLPRAENAE